MNTMNTMKNLKIMEWLIRREFWEHKGMILWAPVRLGLIMLALVVGAILYKGGRSADLERLNTAQNIEMKMEIGRLMASEYMITATPLFLMLAVIVFFYCLGAMYEERRDRSILFWKSLPVSDHQAVLSKVALALVVAPMITIVVGTISALLMLLVVCAAIGFQGINVFGIVFTSGELYLAPLRIFALWPVYLLWAIPTVGWLLMVSAWAKSRVFLWAVGVPVLALIMAAIINEILTLGWDIKWFAGHVLSRGLLGLFPGSWAAFDGGQMITAASFKAGIIGADPWFAQAWLSLGKADVWLGVAAGCAMIFAASRLRRWRDEG